MQLDENSKRQSIAMFDSTISFVTGAAGSSPSGRVSDLINFMESFQKALIQSLEADLKEAQKEQEAPKSKK